MNEIPIRVAHVVGRFISGGVETVVLNYYRNIDHSRIQFDFIMDGNENTPFDNEIKGLGGRIYNITPYAHNIIKNMRECYQIFKINRYPIVHSHLNTLSVFPLAMAKSAGIPIRIAHNHSTAAKGERKTIMKYMLRPLAGVFPNYCLACSEYAGEWLFGTDFRIRENCGLVPNAIDIDKFTYDENIRNKKRRELHVEGKYVIGHVGRFVFPKNHKFIIQIFHEVYKKNKSAVLLLVGTGELMQEIKRQVLELGLMDAVCFLGERFDTHELLQAFDIFLFPSTYEGLGMALIEAQAAGLKCFASQTNVPAEAKVSDLVEFIPLDKTAGYWADCILKYQKGYHRIKVDNQIKDSGYDIKTQSKRLEEYYFKLLDNC